MPSVLSRLSALHKATLPNRRRTMRALVKIEAAVSSVHGHTAQMGIGDISAHGCSLNSEAEWLRTGSFLAITLDGGSTLEGVVRWVRHGKAGVEFLRPVPFASAEWHELIETFSNQ